uniref:Frizzled-4 n=1 Tax=Plectus sambesii TaxID=2011161 RepID=A0A914V7D8_9BILA
MPTGRRGLSERRAAEQGQSKLLGLTALLHSAKLYPPIDDRQRARRGAPCARFPSASIRASAPHELLPAEGELESAYFERPARSLTPSLCLTPDICVSALSLSVYCSAMTEEELWLMSKNRMRDQGESKLPVSSKMNITSSFARTSASPSKDSPSTIFNSSVEKATEKCEENRLLSASNAEENRTIRRIQRERTFSLPCATAQWIIFSLLLFAASSDALLTNSRESAQRRCSPITIPMCQKLGYNQTYFPNRFGHETQEEAGMEAHQFWPLVNVNCYSHLRFFLCAMYAPICQENYDKHVPPCREVCMAAKNGCVQLMQKYGFAWPETLNCNQLPRQSDMQNTGNICAAPPNTPDLHIDTPPSGSELDQPGHRQSFAEHEETPFTTRVDLSSDACDCRCSRPFYLLSDAAMKKVTVGNVSHCAYPCYSPFLRNDNDQQNFLTTWIGIWSIACFCLSLFTVLTFVIEVDRFQYPERPIFVLAFCQMMVSCGYILRLGYGHDMVACEQVRIRNQADGAPLCIAVFVLVYFFGMAAAVW